MMGVVVIILRVIFTIPALVFYGICRLSSTIINTAGLFVQDAMVKGGGILASILTSTIFGALCITPFGIDGIGFLKEYWYIFVIGYIVAVAIIRMSTLYSPIADIIRGIGEWVADLVCPWAI